MVAPFRAPLRMRDERRQDLANILNGAAPQTQESVEAGCRQGQWRVGNGGGGGGGCSGGGSSN